jgi:hypothetical protein
VRVRGSAALFRSWNNSLISPLYVEGVGNEELHCSKPLTRNDAKVDEFKTLKQVFSAVTHMSSDLKIYMSSHRGALRRNTFNNENMN